jgi:flagellar biosynthesis/type III secretory pathway chaperone
MMEKLQNLIGALREELQEYGEMLARLDHHQDLVMRRQTDTLLDSVAQLEAQSAVIQAARDRRERARKELAQALGLSEDAPFADIGPLLPGDYRPLLVALVQENNELLVRIQQRSRQNHLLLARTLEMMQRVMSSLFPGSGRPVYDGTGLILGSKVPQRSLYNAVG